MNDEEIRRLARLAAIDIRDDEVEDVRNAVADIIRLMDKMKDAPTDSTEPLVHPLSIAAAVRDDEVGETDQRKAMQASAPSVSKGLYTVPPVID